MAAMRRRFSLRRPTLRPGEPSGTQKPRGSEREAERKKQIPRYARDDMVVSGVDATQRARRRGRFAP